MALYNLIEKKRKERKRKIVKAATVSTVVGGAVGVLSGVLLAPKSGKETRNDIKEKVEEVKSKTIEQTNNLKENVKEAKSKIKDYLKEKKDADEKELEAKEAKEATEAVEEIEVLEESEN